jgi:carotenoid cleavage dioxygenase-like enzyme
MHSSSLYLFPILFFTTTALKRFFPIFLKHPTPLIRPHIHYCASMQQEILRNISGFYGLIGPDLPPPSRPRRCPTPTSSLLSMFNLRKPTSPASASFGSITNLFDLFIQDGIVQAVFIDPTGEITFVKRSIETERMNYAANMHPPSLVKKPANFYEYLPFYFMSRMESSPFPNMVGVANTAFLKMEDDIYAMYEHDRPYKVHVDFYQQEVYTVRRCTSDYPSTPPHFSGHSKYNARSKLLETIDYNILARTIDYYKMTPTFEVLRKVTLPMKYLPVTHDFLSLENSVLFLDAPIRIHPWGLGKVPVRLDPYSKTYFRVVDQKTMSNVCDTYTFPDGFYVFHYAKGVENDTSIVIYASIYEKLDFYDLNIHGKYRKIVLDKATKTVSMEGKSELDRMNLDFPIVLDGEEEKVVLRNYDSVQKRIDMFVLVDDALNILQKIPIRYPLGACGEPRVIHQQYLVTFAYDTTTLHKEGYFLVFDLFAGKWMEIPLHQSLSVGFHSIYLPHKSIAKQG